MHDVLMTHRHNLHLRNPPPQQHLNGATRGTRPSASPGEVQVYHDYIFETL